MNAASPWRHTTVLLTEAVEALVTQADGIYLDGTFGRGGHARAILDKLSPAGRLVAFDKELNLLRTLRNQAVMAFKQSS